MMTTRKRIAFIHPFMYRFARGIERYTINLAVALIREGMDARVLTWKTHEPFSWKEESDGVEMVALPVSKYYSHWSAFPLYLGHFLRQRYDHVFVHFADYGESQVLNALRFLGRSVPYSVVLHFPYSQVPHRYRTMRSKGVFRNAAGVVAVSAFVAEEAGAFTASEPVVISHGVDTRRYSPDESARGQLAKNLGLMREARFLLTVSALEERKGVQWVLRALPEILGRYPELFYIVVGAGPYREELKMLTRELNLDERVFFVEACTDTERYYQAAELLLIMSRGEASSLVTMESLSCGTPVISSKHRPFDELIRPSWGVQVDEENPADIVHAIRNLIDDSERRLAMGAAGREHILQEHTWKHIARQYIELVLS